MNKPALRFCCILALLGNAAFSADVTVTLISNGVTGNQVVSFGLPLPPGQVTDASQIAVFDGAAEIPAFVEQIVPWRAYNTTGIRSALIQFQMSFASGTEQKTIIVRTGIARTRSAAKTEVAATLQSVNMINVPKVWACLPADWLCASRIDGFQIPAVQNNGTYAKYDQIILSELAAAKNLIITSTAPWLYDRPAAFWKVYIRHGADSVGLVALQKAYSLTETYKTLLAANGDFSLAAPGHIEYVYAECLALQYMLSGDPATLDKIITVGRRLTYQPVQAFYVPTFRWNERNIGTAWGIAIHAYEITGNDTLLNHIKEYMTALWNMQQKPFFLDSALHQRHPQDGGFEHWWDDHDPEEYTGLMGCSPWMTNIIIDAAFKYLLLTGDPRTLTMIRDWGEYVSTIGRNNDMMWYASVNPAIAGTQGYYGGMYFTLLASDSRGDQSIHNWEACLMAAAGYWAGGQTDAAILNAFNAFFAQTPANLNSPPETWNLALRSTAPFLWFMNTAVTPASLVNAAFDTVWRPIGPGPHHPIIAAIQILNLSAHSATITWHTYECGSTSAVDYGMDTTYGMFATGDTMTDAHSVGLTGLSASTTYHFRARSRDYTIDQVEDTSSDQIFTTPASDGVEAGIDDLSSYFTIQPNPFNPATVISFNVRAAVQTPVHIGIYSSSGTLISNLMNEPKGPGNYALTWDGSKYPSGLYLCRLAVGGQVTTARILLMK